MDDLGQVVLKTDPPYQAFLLENHTVNPTCGEDYDYELGVDGIGPIRVDKQF